MMTDEKENPASAAAYRQELDMSNSNAVLSGLAEEISEHEDQPGEDQRRCILAELRCAGAELRLLVAEIEFIGSPSRLVS